VSGIGRRGEGAGKKGREEGRRRGGRGGQGRGGEGRLPCLDPLFFSDNLHIGAD
jgi:hypothetical protein